MTGIYCIRNMVNGKIYIGQSCDINDRFFHHRSNLNHNRHENSHLQYSWNKYGETNFEFSVIEECAEEKLDELERYYISLYDSINPDKGYNNESGGHKLKHISAESRKKMSKAKQGLYDGEKNPMFGVHLKHSEEWKRWASERFSGEGNPMFGVHLQVSDEKKKKMSDMFSGENNPFFGRKHSDETKEKMRRNNKLKKPVVCVETSQKYESVSDASRKTGIMGSSIGKVCSGTQKTAGGFHWEYVT